MCVNNLSKVATQWNSGATLDSNRGRRVLIPSALTTTPLSRTWTWIGDCLPTDKLYLYIVPGLSLWLIGTVRAEPETVISRAWVQSPDPAE